MESGRKIKVVEWKMMNANRLYSKCFSTRQFVNPINFHLYHYAGNNPVKYTDPDGRIIAHIKPLGWSHHAPQRVFGYFNIYDVASLLIGFNINGTRIDGKNFIIRMWKGDYGFAGAGCEIGLYNSNGSSMNKVQLSELGIVSSSSKLYSEYGDGFLLGESKENEPSFWTTQFHPLWGALSDKSLLTAEFKIDFKDEKCAVSFINQIRGKESNAKNYFWNGFFNKENVEFHLSEDKKSIIFKYGNMDYDKN